MRVPLPGICGDHRGDVNRGSNDQNDPQGTAITMLPKSFQDQSNNTWSRENAPEKRPWNLRYPSHCPVGVEDVKRQCSGDCSGYSKVDEVIFGFIFHLLEDWKRGRVARAFASVLPTIDLDPLTMIPLDEFTSEFI